MSPNELEPNNSITSNEITLIDLALTVLKRKRLVAIVFIIIFSLGIIYSLTQTSTTSTHYTYTTSIFIGGRTVNDKIVYLQPPTSVLADIQYIHIPQVLSKTPHAYEVKTELLKNSGVITLTTSSQRPDDNNVISLLNSIGSLAIINHDKYYEAIKTSLASKAQQDSATTALQIVSLKKSSMLDEPQINKVTSVTPAKSTKKILVVSLIGGLLLSVFSAFIAEFITKVRYTIKNK